MRLTQAMTGDVLFSNMLFRYRGLPSGIAMPDSPDSLVKNQIPTSSSNGLTSVNGARSPSGTPSPPSATPSALHPEMAGAARAKQVTKVKQFLAALQQFASKKSPEVGERVHSLIVGLVSSAVSLEDFHLKIQEITNYPLKPYAIPFLKSHLPLLQTELLHFSRLAKLSPQQYLRQNEHLLLDAAAPHAEPAPFDLPPEAAKRRASPPSRNGKDPDYGDSNGEGGPPAKRHHPLASPTLRGASPVAAGLLPPGLSIRVPDAPADHGYRVERFERLERDFYRPFYGNVPIRDYAEEREMDEEWRNIHTMLNCIMGMVEKTKRALCILQHRAERPPDLPWLEPHPKPKPHHLKVAEDRVSEVRRRAEEAVSEVRRAAVSELRQAVSAAEAKAGELVAAERLKMERLLAEARRQAAEDALAQAQHQEESTENCWNCGRKANETCSGCNIARYCGAFCQHKDWESHHRVCATGAAPPKAPASDSPSPPRTDVKPLKMDAL